MLTPQQQAILQHIAKIEQYARQPQNQWLLIELKKRFGGTPPSQPSSPTTPAASTNASSPSLDSQRIERIEKYLALDYQIDSIASNIDYSFVKDELLQKRLISDWREMLRFRCRVRYHKPDFYEFCRYANLQIEGLLNYYQPRIAPFPNDNATNCYFNNKFRQLATAIKLDNNDTKLISSKIYKIRNLKSHSRSINDIGQRIQIVKQKMKDYGLPASPKNSAVCIMIPEDDKRHSTFIQFVNILKTLEIDYYEYYAEVWATSTPYDDVELALLNFTKKIQAALIQ